MITVFMFFTVGCTENTELVSQSVPSSDESGAEDLVSSIRQAEAASSILSRTIDWEDPPYRPTEGERKIFKAPPPIPDELHAYTAKLNGEPFAVGFERFGSIWKATVIKRDDSVRHYYGKSENECRQQIEKDYDILPLLEPVPFHPY